MKFPALLALPVALACLLPLPAADAQGPARDMIEAVIASFPLDRRQVYLAPGLEPSATMLESGIRGRPRHRPETLERIRQRFDARIAYPEEAISCADPARRESCVLPDNGILFYFFMPDPLENEVLPVRVIVFHDGRGEDGGILREVWDFRVRRHAEGGWSVADRNLRATEGGPG